MELFYCTIVYQEHYGIVTPRINSDWNGDVWKSSFIVHKNNIDTYHL